MSPPHISLVTPSFNQKPFLADTLRSVLDQGYPTLDYVVMDGGSADGSVDVLTSYSDQLTYWQSEPDGGQYNAIQKGFERTSGEIMGWLNSDDMHFPWTLKLVGQIFASFPEVDWITSQWPANWNAEGVPCHFRQKGGFSKRYFQKGLYLSTPGKPSRVSIQQESTFWRRTLWEKAGSGFDPAYPLAGDFDLWARFFQHSDLVGIEAPLAGFRKHGHQRSVIERDQYRKEALHSLRRHQGEPERGLSAWIRESGLGACWPLRVMPRFGWIQPVRNIQWSVKDNKWNLTPAWVTH